MSIISHTIDTAPQSPTRVNLTIVFTDHLGDTFTIRKQVPTDFDSESWALSYYSILEEQAATGEVSESYENAENGVNPDKTAIYQTQSEFDRRLLGRLMVTEDVNVFYAGLPFFQAVESRGGANANQRAIYLDVPRAEYDLVAARFGDVQGISFFLDDAKNAIWPDIPDGWM
jgi:hypothetical protein